MQRAAIFWSLTASNILQADLSASLALNTARSPNVDGALSSVDSNDRRIPYHNKAFARSIDLLSLAFESYNPNGVDAPDINEPEIEPDQ